MKNGLVYGDVKHEKVLKLPSVQIIGIDSEKQEMKAETTRPSRVAF